MIREIGKISIITPCFNSKSLIKDTIESIIYQSAVLKGDVELQYIIVDGGSTDGTIEIIESFNSKHINLISEQDNGMYDALSKGLKIADGDIVGYLNAGDLYYRYAFELLIKIFSNAGINWITGLSVYYDENNIITSIKLPFKFRKKMILSGYYIKENHFIQQESTFWSQDANRLIRFDELSRFRFAGDYFIWCCFAVRYDLYIIESFLGGFKIHFGQLSNRYKEYLIEASSFTKNKSFYLYLLSFIDNIIWQFPSIIKKKLNTKLFLKYNQDTESWS